MTVKAMKADVVEFLIKPLGQDSPSNAIRDALARSQMTLGHAAETQAFQDRYGSRSGPEREGMAFVTSCMMHEQVGGKGGISEITVRAYRGKVMRKMQAQSLADSASISEALGHASGRHVRA